MVRLRSSRYLTLFNFITEMLDNAAYRVWCRLPEPADRGICHRHRKLLEQPLVPGPGFHQLERLGRAHTAGGALSTGFVSEEPHQVPRGTGGLVLVGKDNDRR